MLLLCICCFRCYGFVVILDVVITLVDVDVILVVVVDVFDVVVAVFVFVDIIEVVFPCLERINFRQ